jgi:hypothetical protein
MQLPPEPRDPRVDAAIESLSVVVAQQLGAINNPIGSIEQNCEETNLRCRQIHLLASRTRHVVAALGECPSAEAG